MRTLRSLFNIASYFAIVMAMLAATLLAFISVFSFGVHHGKTSKDVVKCVAEVRS